MKVKFLKDCAVRGESFKAGKTAEVDDQVAKVLLAMGRAVKSQTRKEVKKDD